MNENIIIVIFVGTTTTSLVQQRRRKQRQRQRQQSTTKIFNFIISLLLGIVQSMILLQPAFLRSRTVFGFTTATKRRSRTTTSRIFNNSIIPTTTSTLMTKSSSSSKSTRLSIRTTTTLLQQSKSSSNNNNNKNLWSIEECIEKRNDIKFIDGSWYHKGNRNGRQEFEAGPRLPNANYLDMDDISTQKELFPDLNPKNLNVMFPPPSLFAATMDAMEISPDDQVIIYGRKGCWFTPRTWYLFKTYGHSNVGLMQGSLEDWVELGGPIETDPIKYNIWAKDLLLASTTTKPTTKTKYPVSSSAKDRFVDMDGVLDRYQTMKVVDTRGSSYNSKGHIPGSIHIPYSSLVESDNSLKFKSKQELSDIVSSKKVPTDEPILLSCGHAVSVCHMALVLNELDYPPPLVYDGSWNEWGSDPNTPKEYV